MLHTRFVILVVDDEERIRHLISDQLESGGYEVILAATGDEAFAILQATPRIDMIVTDVRMPGVLNGFDLVERALSHRPKLRTIIMSGYTGETTSRGARADLFLKKPFTLWSLEKSVEDVLAA